MTTPYLKKGDMVIEAGIYSFVYVKLRNFLMPEKKK
jgi:hypothetical protein